MTLLYVHNGQPVAEGERTMFLEGGRMFVRTGLVGTDMADPANMTVTYRLREVYQAGAPIPSVTLDFEVPSP